VCGEGRVGLRLGPHHPRLAPAERERIHRVDDRAPQQLERVGVRRDAEHADRRVRRARLQQERPAQAPRRLSDALAPSPPAAGWNSAACLQPGWREGFWSGKAHLPANTACARTRQRAACAGRRMEEAGVRCGREMRRAHGPHGQPERDALHHVQHDEDEHAPVLALQPLCGPSLRSDAAP